MEQPKIVDQMTIAELKCAAYDCIALSEKLQQDLRVINTELARKSQQVIKEPENTEPPK
jgi:uncharacterized coiled-coil protein SlyX